MIDWNATMWKGWCDASLSASWESEWSGVKGFITPSRFGAILKYETAAVVARASGKVWCKSSGQRKGSSHWKHNGFSGRRKKLESIERHVWSYRCSSAYLLYQCFLKICLGLWKVKTWSWASFSGSTFQNKQLGYNLVCDVTKGTGTFDPSQ